MSVDDGSEKGECKFANCNRDSADNCNCGNCKDDCHGIGLLYLLVVTLIIISKTLDFFNLFLFGMTGAGLGMDDIYTPIVVEQNVAMALNLDDLRFRVMPMVGPWIIDIRGVILLVAARHKGSNDSSENGKCLHFDPLYY